MALDVLASNTVTWPAWVNRNMLVKAMAYGTLPLASDRLTSSTKANTTKYPAGTAGAAAEPRPPSSKPTVRKNTAPRPAGGQVMSRRGRRRPMALTPPYTVTASNKSAIGERPPTAPGSSRACHGHEMSEAARRRRKGAASVRASRDRALCRINVTLQGEAPGEASLAFSW